MVNDVLLVRKEGRKKKSGDGYFISKSSSASGTSPDAVPGT